MNWKEEYQSKLLTLAEAAGLVQSGDTIQIGVAASEPVGLLEELANQADRLFDVTLWTCLPMRAYDIFVKPEMEGHFFNENWFYGAPDRAVHLEGRVSYTPNNLHRAGRDKLVGNKGKLDMFMGTCTPPNADGMVSLSMGVVVEREMIDAARTVILEVNRNLPWTDGDTVIPISMVDHFVENDSLLVQVPQTEPSETEEQIGRHVAQYIEDGCTVQLGIGGMPTALADFISDRRHLGIHSELLVDGVYKLYESGAVDNSRKTLHPGKFVATALTASTTEEIEFIHENPVYEVYDVEYTNDIQVIASHDNMVAINNAMSVDLTGQIAAESIGRDLWSGPGGQLEFVIGAMLSKGGRSVTVLPSTARNGEVSRITLHHEPGTIVTVPRQFADYVVTEHGIARLFGKSDRERADELISIAHPDHRAELRRQVAKG